MFERFFSFFCAAEGRGCPRSLRVSTSLSFKKLEKVFSISFVLYNRIECRHQLVKFSATINRFFLLTPLYLFDTPYKRGAAFFGQHRAQFNTRATRATSTALCFTIMTRSHCVAAATCLTLTALVAVAPGVVDAARLSPNNEILPTTKAAPRSLLSHLRGTTTPSGSGNGWEWTWNGGGGQEAVAAGGGSSGDGFILPFLFRTTPSTSLDVTDDASDYEAYNLDFNARLEAAALDIFASFFRLISMTFEPLWRSMRLDLGLGWITPPSPAPTNLVSMGLTPHRRRRRRRVHHEQHRVSWFDFVPG